MQNFSLLLNRISNISNNWIQMQLVNHFLKELRTLFCKYLLNDLQDSFAILEKMEENNFNLILFQIKLPNIMPGNKSPP